MTHEELKKYIEDLDKRLGNDVIHYQDKEPQPEDGVFEIGLVLAGAISAGCYSAGVMDYLIEALDAWEAEKKVNPNVPQHQVKIRVFAGASAGSMTSAIAAAALRYDFPHIRSNSPVTGYTNPFYESWVKRIDINLLLGDKDLQADPTLVSLLDSTELAAICNDALDAGEQYRQQRERPYLDGRVRFIFTQCGLTGTPYYLPMQGPFDGGLAMTLHKTYRSFSVNYTGGATLRRPDDLALDAAVVKKSQDANWQQLGNAALGSGAFPIGLAPRKDTRPVTDLFYRYVVVPASGSDQVVTKRIYPAWLSAGNPPAPTALTSDYIVDGGVMDNEPLDLARIETAGLIGNNERSGELARRATIMIDPFPDVFSLTDPDEKKMDIIDAAAGLMNAWKNQSRFNPVDLALANDGNVYSRFLIAPVRVEDGKHTADGPMTIASGVLGGFGGFLSEEYRRHDYLLGRRNCQQFLRRYFSLPASNPLFQTAGNFDTRNQRSAEKDEVPIIPLVAALTLTEPLPAMPTTPVNVTELVEKANARLGNATQAGFNMTKLGGIKLWLAKMGAMWLRNEVKKTIQQKVQDMLRAYQLPYR